MKLVVIAPHFAPDVAPTGAVITRIVEELALRDHHIEVITSLPWYRDHRVDPDFDGRLVRREDTPWGSILRIDPFATEDKSSLMKRGLSFAGFSALAGWLGRKGDNSDAVFAMSPPLSLGLTGWAVARARHAPLVFNIQDVFPDVAIDVGAITSPRVITAARALERFCYARADAVTVLSEDLKVNLDAKVDDPRKVRVIPNFVDTRAIVPMDANNDYRRENELEGRFVVMYAGNIGFSQSLDLVLEAAAALSYEEDVVFVINGGGSALDELRRKARGLANVRFVGMQPAERLPQVLAAGDVHVVPLKAGLARSSVPSKTYSILAAGRPLVASVDRDSEVARVVAAAEAGIAVPPEDPEAFTKAIRTLAESRDRARAMGAAGRAWVESWASPAAIAASYEELFAELAEGRSGH